MKEYSYYSVHIGKFIGAGSMEHRDIIDEFAEKGYRYVGFVPTDISDHGKFRIIDLIFEKDTYK